MKQAYFYFFLLFSCFALLTSSQQRNSNATQDSLKAALDRQSVDILIEFSNELKFSQPEKAANHAERAYELSKSIRYQQGIIPGAFLLGIYERDAKNFKKAARLISEGIEAARKIKDQSAELRGLEILQEIYRLDKRQKKLAETELEYKKLKDYLDLNRKASQLSVLKRAYATKESALRQSESERNTIQEVLDQTVEEKLVEQAQLALLAQEKAELEVKTLQMENEAAQNALEISEKEKALLAFNARLKRQQSWQIFWIMGFIASILIIVYMVRYYRLKRVSEEEKQKARQQLEMQEKMATLGQLSAGIAHEIKNPLNFVNNFAVGSTGIVEEIEDHLMEHPIKMQEGHYALLKELIGELKQNSIDIYDNGQRIDRIVNSMMDHARDSNGEMQWIDINNLAKENLNLAYLGFRALKPSFQANIEENYDPALKRLEGIPQELGRVLLNIFNNACYALYQQQQMGNHEVASTLGVTTQIQGEEAVILIRDNGPGIPAKDRKKIFTPFFTTKPTGEGNAGLGLSISYDIIVQRHHGNIEMNSEPGAYTEFVIRLPLHQGDAEDMIRGEHAPG